MGRPAAEEVAASPAPELRPFVTSYVGFRLSGFPPGVHLGPPTGALTAVISLADPLAVGDGPGSSGRRERFTSLTAGVTTRSIPIHHDGHQFGVKLTLTPLGARAVYGVPAAELANRVTSLDELVGTVGPEIAERLAARRTWAGRFRALDEVLGRVVRRTLDRQGGVVGARPEVVESWRRLVASRGDLQVSDLATQLGWSRRHLTERFREELGLPPKTLARILRFEHAYHLATTDQPPPWSDVAATAGYTDQAHLVRDWRDFTGVTPTAWRRGEVLNRPGG